MSFLPFTSHHFSTHHSPQQHDEHNADHISVHDTQNHRLNGIRPTQHAEDDSHHHGAQQPCPHTLHHCTAHDADNPHHNLFLSHHVHQHQYPHPHRHTTTQLPTHAPESHYKDHRPTDYGNPNCHFPFHQHSAEAGIWTPTPSSCHFGMRGAPVWVVALNKPRHCPQERSGGSSSPQSHHFSTHHSPQQHDEHNADHISVHDTQNHRLNGIRPTQHAEDDSHHHGAQQPCPHTLHHCTAHDADNPHHNLFLSHHLQNHGNTHDSHDSNPFHRNGRKQDCHHFSTHHSPQQHDEHNTDHISVHDTQNHRLNGIRPTQHAEDDSHHHGAQQPCPHTLHHRTAHDADNPHHNLFPSHHVHQHQYPHPHRHATTQLPPHAPASHYKDHRPTDYGNPNCHFPFHQHSGEHSHQHHACLN
ncbi:UNVERIFIED_CONTAM: hypothetical protein K2H54_061549 [Gekko kuhli]